jgi:hypothetical protein
MPQSEARVDPNQPWGEDGTADVTPMPPMEAPMRNLRLENHGGGPLTVQRSNYPEGLVVITSDNPPATLPTILPLRSSSGDEIYLENDDHQEWPDGVVTWFTD